MENLKHLTVENFDEQVKEGIVFVSFWAPWCGPCRMMAPVYEQVAEEIGDITVGKVNSDENQSLAVKFGVRSIPSMFILKDGEVVDSMVGAQSKQSIIDKINAIR